MQTTITKHQTMSIYTITLRNPGIGSFDITRDAESDNAAKRIATAERARFGAQWIATLYRTDPADGTLEYLATRTARGWYR